jgi:hypothetical protein
LGIDFGTKFTKVCFRDTDNEISWVVTFADGNPSLDEALISSKIAICTDGTLLAGLTESEWQKQTQDIGVLIDYLKMRLASIDLTEEGIKYPLNSLEKFNDFDLNDPEILENLCVYHLACTIIKAKKWIHVHHEDLVKKQKINWSANVGVPVKYCDSAAIERFKKVLRLAWELIESLPQSFNELQERMQHLRKNIAYDEIPCFTIPEISAGVYSYTASRQAREGIYMFFDIGSGTIEGATFRFFRENEVKKMDFYIGEVEPLGVNALAKFVNSEVPGLEAQVEEDIINNGILEEINSLSKSLADSWFPEKGEYIVNQFGVTNRLIAKTLQSDISPQKEKLLYLILGQYLIRKLVANVVMTSKTKNREYFQQSLSLRLFIGGGGSESKFYQNTIDSTHCAFGHKYAGVPMYDVQELAFPDGLDMNGINKYHFHRFAVAYGLSIPEDTDEAPRVQLPSLLPYQSPPIFQPITPEIGRYPEDHSSM